MHLVWFKSIGEAVELARRYLGNDGERERIARIGREEVLTNHTWDHRMAWMMEYVREAGYDFA
jgi:spore maturation protein CgeB